MNLYHLQRHLNKDYSVSRDKRLFVIIIIYFNLNNPFCQSVNQTFNLSSYGEACECIITS